MNNVAKIAEYFPDMTPGEPFPNPHRLPEVRFIPGQVTKPPNMPRVNDPCPCKSGKKFKKCCLPKIKDQRARMSI